MTRVTVDAGVCGFITTVEVTRLSSQLVSVAIVSDCELVGKMGQELASINWQEALKPRVDSPVHKAAREHLKHVACPVSVAILKAIEVEIGAALPKDVVLRF